MNNAQVIQEEEPKNEVTKLREKSGHLAELIEALQNIDGSTYWTVIKKQVFDVDLSKAKRRLALEKDTTEIFRLQGEIRWAEKFDLKKVLDLKRNELQELRRKL